MRGLSVPFVWILAAVLLSLLAAALSLAGRASGDGGDFQMDFVAAHEDTYNHVTGIELTPGSLQYDERDMTEDTREELEAVDFQCEDRIAFFTQISIGETATEDAQGILITYHFDARNNGQEAVGYREVVAVGVSARDFTGSQTAEDGHVALDGDETAALVNQQYLNRSQYDVTGEVSGDFGDDDAEVLEALVRVTGLNAGEVLIVRVDVRFACFGSDPTGNLHAALYWAETSEGDRISVGQQDIPMLGLGNLPTPTPPPPTETPPPPTETPPPPTETPPPPTETPPPPTETPPPPTETPLVQPTPTPTPAPSTAPESPTPAAPSAVAGVVVGPESLPAAGGGDSSFGSDWQQLLLLIGLAAAIAAVAAIVGAHRRTPR